MPATTPISRSKTAALSRILDGVSKGYTRYTQGTVKASKAESLANKFHSRYGIGCTPAERLIRKKEGISNAILALYWPDASKEAHWMLLATPGAGMETERLVTVEGKPRATWLGYELVRHSANGRASWTWRRTKKEMQELFMLIASQASQNRAAIEETLQRIARQPGFHGVRTQSWQLCEEARRRGYGGPLPHLFFLQKVSHGERMALEASLAK